MQVKTCGQGGIVVLADRTRSDPLVASMSATPMEMRGRSMPGWVRVPADDVRTKRELRRWARLGVGYARTLPVKG